MRIIDKKKKGFTLIELLVVVAIISLLSSIVMASLNSARVKARDATRMSDMREIQKAIELYYSNAGHYPNGPFNNGSYASCWGLSGTNGATPDKWIPDGSDFNWINGHISRLPQDPINNCIWPWGNAGAAPGTAGTYEYWSDGNKYLIAARLENTSSPHRAEVTGIIDPRFNQPYSTYWTNAGGTTAKYVFVVTN